MEVKYCCDDMMNAIEDGKLKIKSNGYITTHWGIYYPDDNPNKTLALKYCPHCSKEITIVRKDPDKKKES